MSWRVNPGCVQGLGEGGPAENEPIRTYITYEGLLLIFKALIPYLPSAFSIRTFMARSLSSTFQFSIIGSLLTKDLI